MDRLEAEAEFRFSVALPVAFVGIAAAVAAPGPGQLYWITGVALGIVLIGTSVAVSVVTEDTMVDLVADRVVQLPVIAAIFGEERADTQPRPSAN
jgi:hypothetical protein